MPDSNYFADAVFIGDSRTEGLRLYGGMTTSFLSYTGQSIFHVQAGRVSATTTHGTTSVYAALENTEYAKIYISLGINDFSRGAASYGAALREVVDRIKQLRPNALIYLMTLAPVNEQMAVNAGYSVTNATITAFNAEIRNTATEKGTFCVDVYSHFANEYGSLNSGDCWDGIHLNILANRRLAEFLNTQIFA